MRRKGTVKGTQGQNEDRQGDHKAHVGAGKQWARDWAAQESGAAGADLR